MCQFTFYKSFGIACTLLHIYINASKNRLNKNSCLRMITEPIFRQSSEGSHSVFCRSV